MIRMVFLLWGDNVLLVVRLGCHSVMDTDVVVQPRETRGAQQQSDANTWHMVDRSLTITQSGFSTTFYV